MLSAHLLGSLSKQYDSTEFVSDLFPIVTYLCNDFHSIVRFSICQYIRYIANTIGSKQVNEEFFPSIIELMEDVDDVVRSEAVD